MDTDESSVTFQLNPRREPVITVDADTWGPGAVYLGTGKSSLHLGIDEAEALAEALTARAAFVREWISHREPKVAAA